MRRPPPPAGQRQPETAGFRLGSGPAVLGIPQALPARALQAPAANTRPLCRARPAPPGWGCAPGSGQLVCGQPSQGRKWEGSIHELKATWPPTFAHIPRTQCQLTPWHRAPRPSGMENKAIPQGLAQSGFQLLGDLAPSGANATWNGRGRHCPSHWNSPSIRSPAQNPGPLPRTPVTHHRCFRWQSLCSAVLESSSLPTCPLLTRPPL